MIDRDLALLYEVETRVFNQAVKRNSKRFPDDFMFRLSREEWEVLKNQIPITENGMSSQFVMTSHKKRPNSSLPYAFTEQGIAMLSGILNSDTAIKMNIAIMRAFVEVRKILLRENDWKEQLNEIRENIGDHDIRLNQIYTVLESMLNEKETLIKWQERERIGFKT